MNRNIVSSLLLLVVLNLILDGKTLNQIHQSTTEFNIALLSSSSPEMKGTDIVIIGNNSSGYPKDQLLKFNSGCNIGLWKQLTPFKNNSQIMVLMLPKSLEKFVQNLREIIKSLEVDENSASGIWDPTFFIQFPIIVESDLESHFDTMDDVENYLREHISSLLRLDSDVFIIFKSRLYEIYNSFNKDLQIIEINNQIHFIQNYLKKSVRRQDFKGSSIKAVGLGDPDFEQQCKLKVVNGTVKFVSGLAVELLHTLQFAMNFSYIGVEGEGWIEQLENGTWLGMARQIRAGDADLAISQSTQISYRFKGLGFLHPTSGGLVKVFFRQPPASSIRDIFISPFKAEIWGLLLLIWFLIISSIIFIYWIRYRYALINNDNEIEQFLNQQIAMESVFWCFGAFCQKGWYIGPSTTSMRVVFFCSFVVGVIYYVAYSASLVSSLSVEIIPIQSIEDLSKSELVILGDFWLPNNHIILKSMETSMTRLKVLKEDKQYIEIDKAIPTLLTSSTAFITFADGFLTVMRRHNYTDGYYCETFSSLNAIKAPVSSGMVVQKGSPLKEMFNPKILMMTERGFTKRFNRHYALGTSARCSVKIGKLGNQGLGLSDVFTIYFILAGGFSFSLFCVLCEYFFYNFR